MKIQQQAADRVYELIPELKELSFGCEVIEDKVKQTVIKYVHTKYDSDCGEVYTTEHPTEFHKKWRYYENDSFKIIGHPIRLADILRAINKHSSDFMVVSENGSFLKRTAPKEYEKMGEYDFTKDNLLEQSDEFCEWLLKILK
jgi:hypothetical protein